MVGAVLVVFFLESTRFATGCCPGSRRCRAPRLREFLIGASLILVLRFRPPGLIPERIEPIPRPAAAS